MKWLHDLAGKALTALGVDISTRLGGSLHFFFFDAVKIVILLSTLIFVISYVQSYFPPERTKKLLGGIGGFAANLASALLGTVTPFCSCSSIPLFIGFTSAGLPAGVTFSFLISSPLVDLGSLVLLTGIFGAKIAVAYVVIGLVLAVTGGTIIDALHMEDQIEPFIRSMRPPELHSPQLSAADRLLYAKGQMLFTLKKVFPYILAGVGIGAAIHNWLPDQLVQRALGTHNSLAVIAAVIIGIPMYADIFGTIPIAEALYAKGAGLGTLMAFMMSVTALSLPSIIMLRQAVKPKLLTLFVALVTLGIAIIGFAFNAFGYLFI